MNARQRLDDYNRLGSVIRNLVNALYGSKEDYLTRPHHAIDDILIGYDFMLGDGYARGSLVNAPLLGIEIPLEVNSEDIDNFTLDKLAWYFNTARTQQSRGLSLMDVVDMGSTDFANYMRDNHPHEDVSYETRLDFVMNEYYTLRR